MVESIVHHRLEGGQVYEIVLVHIEADEAEHQTLLLLEKISDDDVCSLFSEGIEEHCDRDGHEEEHSYYYVWDEDEEQGIVVF